VKVGVEGGAAKTNPQKAIWPQMNTDEHGKRKLQFLVFNLCSSVFICGDLFLKNVFQRELNHPLTS
jgi:hypothetical protein